MASPAHGHQQVMGAGKVHRLPHVRPSHTASNEGWMLVDIGIPDAPCRIIGGLPRQEEFAPQTRPECGDFRFC